MPIPEIATKAEFSRIADVSKARVSQYIDTGVIGEDAIVGTGPKAKIRVKLALSQIHARRDVGQAVGNGAKTRTRLMSNPASVVEPGREAADEDIEGARSVAPTVSTDVQERIAEERLKEIERRNRQGDDEEAARRGIFTLTSDATRAMNGIAVQMMRAFDGMLPDMATAVAAELKADARHVLHVMTQASLTARERMSERIDTSGDQIPGTREIDTAALLRPHNEGSP